MATQGIGGQHGLEFLDSLFQQFAAVAIFVPFLAHPVVILPQGVAFVLPVLKVEGQYATGRGENRYRLFE